MSKRKKRKTRHNKKEYSELELLVRKRDALVRDREKLVSENKKKLRLRKLHLYLAVMKLTLPFVISSGACVGGGSLLFHSLPFVVDDQTLTKKYSLKVDDDNIDYNETYYKSSIFDEDEEDELEVKYDFLEGDDGTYSRSIERYTYEDKDVLAVIEAVLNDDCATLRELAETTDILTETKNSKPSVSSGSIKGQVSFVNEAEHFTTKESDFKNIGLTVGELFIGGLVSIVGFMKSDRDLKRKKSDLEREYLLVDLTNIDSEIVEIEKKLQKVRGIEK